MTPIAKSLQQGRLEQTCLCGRTEAAGVYCSRCHRPTGEGEWYRNGDMQSRMKHAGEAPATLVKGGSTLPSHTSGHLTLGLGS